MLFFTRFAWFALCIYFAFAQRTDKSDRINERTPNIIGIPSKKCPLLAYGEELDVDKVNPFHNYQLLYCELFKPLRQSQLTMLEIGFGCGHHIAGRSCLLWNRYFPKLTYYSMDYLNEGNKEKVEKCISDFQRDYPGKLKKIWLGDQASPPFLISLIREYSLNNATFDIIIDDGGHKTYQILESFRHLWPLVSSGGYYIIEDLAWDTQFSLIMGEWIKLIGSGRDTGKKGGDIITSLPQHTAILGCSFQICYLRKVVAGVERMPSIWGEKD